jgi:hypothetical protein
MAPTSALYDLYLTAGCAGEPPLADLRGTMPRLGDTAVRVRLLQRSPGPGFLGLDLPADAARVLLGRLMRAEAHGELVPAAYRRPRIDILAGQSTAERALIAQAGREFPGYTFRPVRYWREGPRWWVFGMIADALVDQGHVPGGVLAYVDKLDGHIWQPDELQLLLDTR